MVIPTSVIEEYLWTDKEIRLIIYLYKKNLQLFSKNPDQFWKKLSSGLAKKAYTRTVSDCQKLCKQLNDVYKKCVDNNNGSGNAPMTCTYIEVSCFFLATKKYVRIKYYYVFYPAQELNDIFKGTPWIRPETVAGSLAAGELSMPSRKSITTSYYYIIKI